MNVDLSNARSMRELAARELDRIRIQLQNNRRGAQRMREHLQAMDVEARRLATLVVEYEHAWQSYAEEQHQ